MTGTLKLLAWGVFFGVLFHGYSAGLTLSIQQKMTPVAERTFGSRYNL